MPRQTPTPTKVMGEHLRARRDELGLSTQAVAGKAGISAGYLFKLESGYVGSPSPRVLHRLAGVLGVPYWTLMGLAGYAIPERDDAGERMPDLPAPQTDREPGMQRVAALLEAVLAEIRGLRGDLQRSNPGPPE